MGASWEAKLPKEFTFPATVGVVVVLVTALVLLVISSRRTRKLLGGKGTKFMVDEDGANVVRRSTRSTKKPTRFEPVVHGQGGTPAKDDLSPLEKATQLIKTPKSEPANETPVGRRVVSRPRKTPQKDAASPPASPVRTRRGARTPK